MAKHELELLPNALDSFNEALSKYRAAESGEQAAYKFAILHFSHFLELLFKYYVSKSHPLLIYKNPFAKNIDSQQTIGLWEAVQFLQNEGHKIDSKFKKDLEWLKNLRNNIEHHKFTMDPAEVKIVLGRLTQALLEFNEHFADFNISDYISTENLAPFTALSDAYQTEIADLRKQAEATSETGQAETCNICGNETAAMISDEYVCLHCNETDYILACCVCGQDERRSNMTIWNEEHDDYICETCEDRITHM